MNGKGDAPRKVDRKKWDDCPLWDNMKRDALWESAPDVHGPASEISEHSVEDKVKFVEDFMDKYESALKELKD